MNVGALTRRSIEVIREGQAPTGAYLACPTFAPYRYCWFRDGCFIADAMSRVGEVESAEAFFAWCSRVLLARAERVGKGERPHARYTADGEESQEEWPTFQLDGLGLLLWALREHEARHHRTLDGYRGAGNLVGRYLGRNWREACTDWWEEREGAHAVTLGSIAAGLRAWACPEWREVLECVPDPASARLDASLLALAVPLRVADVEPGLVAPLVSPGGGVHRHLEDEYYGGGEWPLLTALLGWVELERGDLDAARQRLCWVAEHATEEGLLPEQSQDHLLRPDRWQPWVERWGPPPCPLLWSHALFLTLAHELAEAA